MAYKKELTLVNEFINHFKPKDYTTNKDQWTLAGNNKEGLIRNAQKVKARIQRKQMLKRKYLSIDFSELLNASDEMISQEQIDELLTEK